MPRVLQTAMQHAVSKRGVAVIVLSGDVAAMEVPSEAFAHGLVTAQPADTLGAIMGGASAGLGLMKMMGGGGGGNCGRPPLWPIPKRKRRGRRGGMARLYPGLCR